MQQKVKFPAIGLIVLGVLGILSALISMFMGALEASQLVEMGMPEDQATQIADLMGKGGVMMNVFALAVAGFITWAGFQMLHLRAWTAAVIANILVMIPCFTSCCCLFGIGIGIWGLIVLFNADVKRAFEGQATPPPL